MSDEQQKRETIVAFAGSANDGNARFQAAWLGSQIEITVSEENGADSSVVLSKVQADDLARSLLAALRTVRPPAPPIEPQAFIKCAIPECLAFATCHVTEVDSENGEAKIIDLCELHAQRHCNR